MTKFKDRARSQVFRRTSALWTKLAGVGLAAVLAAFIFVAPSTAAQPQGIVITSFLYGSPDPSDPTDPNLLAVSGCFAVTGAIVDQGGEPQFDTAGNIVGCGSPAGIAGFAHFDGLGHLKTGEPNVLQAAHTMFGANGQIQIKFEGKYGPIVPVDSRFLATTEQGGGWQITCGTGAYAGLRGVGTSTAVADFTPAIFGLGPVTVVHIDTGTVSATGEQPCA
jgi:hypothetical protein